MKNKIVLALGVGLAAFVAHLVPPLLFGAAQTPDFAYFNYLADAFLHGRLYLTQPPATHDLTLYAGRWYVPFPPTPALLMLPFVALLGLEAFNTVLFAASLGALNVVLIWLVLDGLAQRGWTGLRTADNLWLTVLFGLGSVHWTMSTSGAVWFVAQVSAVTFVALAVLLAVKGRSPWLVGLALGLAVAARPTVAFTWPLLLGIAATHLGVGVARQDVRQEWPSLLRWAVRSAVPVALAVAALLVYNWARFADPLNFGYMTENVDRRFVADLHRYGQFNLHYLPRNLWALWLAGPLWDAQRNFWFPDPEGMSILLTTPAIIYLMRARGRSWLVIGGWLALILTAIPVLLYYNSGWQQFGYRFSLDFMVPVVVLLALAAGSRTSWPMRALIALGVVVNLYGVIWWLA